MRSYHGFKKIAADEKSTTFAHPNGSQLIVAHTTLDPKTLKKISSLPVHKMANGGELPPPSMPDPQKARDANAGLEKGQSWTEGWQNLKHELGVGSNEQKPAQQPAKKGYARGGKVQKFSGEGGDPSESEVSAAVDQNTSANPYEAPQEAAPAAAHDEPLMQHIGSLIGKYGVAPIANAVTSLGQAAISTAKSAGQLAGGITQGAEQGTGMYLPGSTAPGAPKLQPAVAEKSTAPTNVNLAPAAASQPMQLPRAGQDYDPYKGLNMQQAGNTNEARAIGNLENQKANIYQNHQQELADLNYQAQQNAWNNHVETQNIIDDMKQSHIDPRAYVNNMTGGQKVSTAIGLLLGGIGGGLTHTGVNPAMDFLNKQIDRDVAAQKANVENKQTIFNAMQKQYGNQQDAVKMTHAFYLAKLQNEIGTAAAKSGSPLAMARAQQLNGPLESQLQQLHFEVGMRQAALNGLAGGKNISGALQYLVHDKTKVEDASKAYGAASELNEHQRNALQSFDQIHSKFMNGMLSPNDTQSAKQAFIGSLQVALEHRYNPEAAAALGDALFPSKTDTSETTVQNKRNRLIEEFSGARAQHDAVLRGLTSGLVGAPKPPPSGFRKR